MNINIVEVDPADTQYQSHILDAVYEDKDGWHVRSKDGWTLYVTNKHCTTPPQDGERMIVYGRGLGYPVRGIDIGGRVYLYMTEAQHEQAEIDERLAAKAKRLAEFVAGRAEFNRRVSALPIKLRERMEQFLATSDEWGAAHGNYELFVCEEAAKVLGAFSSSKDIEAFWHSSYENQKAAVPGLAYDKHSGNTLGAALMLARVYLTNRDLVPVAHAAICPLVGCSNAGCYAGRERVTRTAT